MRNRLIKALAAKGLSVTADNLFTHDAYREPGAARIYWTAFGMGPNGEETEVHGMRPMTECAANGVEVEYIWFPNVYQAVAAEAVR